MVSPRVYSEARFGLVCLVLMALVALVDFRIAPQVRLTVFYLLIIAMGAWRGGTLPGIGLAAISSLALVLRELEAAGPQPLPGWVVWNIAMQSGVYLSAALILSALKRVTAGQNELLKERAAYLEQEMLDHTQTEEQLRKTMLQFRHLADNITDVFWLRSIGNPRIGYISPAYDKIWGRSRQELYRNPPLWLNAIHPEDRAKMAQLAQDFENHSRYDQEYRIRQPGGAVRWIRERAFPVRDNAGRVVRIAGIAEDITDRRRLERQIIEVSDREQARIGQDLHDSLCQKLVSLAFDINSLSGRLASRATPEAAAAQQMGLLLDDVITEARAVARGLYPVQLESDGLDSALRQLAATAGSRSGIECRLECAGPVHLPELAVATHLYRIAQEAVNNAVKHSRARLIVIALRVRDQQIELRVTDNGIGLPSSYSRNDGMGLHTMEYRARTIGGTLSVERGPEGGTVVTCVAPQIFDWRLT